MNLISKLSNNSLHEQTLEAAAREKNATLTLLEFLAEVDQRRVYAERGYPTLWEYVRKALGYSESQTSERISAMRLTRRVPEIKENLKQGKLTLTSTLQLSYFAKREKLSPEKTVSVMQNILGKSKRDVEKVFLSLQTVPAPKPDSVKVVGADSCGQSTSRIAFDADEEFVQLIERIKQIKGNPALGLQDLFKIAMKEFVGRREVKQKSHRQVSQQQNRQVSAGTNHNKLHPAEVVNQPPGSEYEQNSRYVSVKVRASIRNRSKDQCEYVEPITNYRCESKSGLQFDHILPHAIGGTSELHNIRHLCRTHNLLAATQVYGAHKMNRYLKM